jgi:hypothetical protein
MFYTLSANHIWGKIEWVKFSTALLYDILDRMHAVVSDAIVTQIEFFDSLFAIPLANTFR